MNECQLASHGRRAEDGEVERVEDMQLMRRHTPISRANAGHEQTLPDATDSGPLVSPAAFRPCGPDLDPTRQTPRRMMKKRNDRLRHVVGPKLP
jgi:hypothetical protein